MNSKETQLHRHAMEVARGKVELADELKRGLLLLRYLGQCKCGLMLTERDQGPTKKRYSCPHCGATGTVEVAV